jgi:hypothetical protein
LGSALDARLPDTLRFVLHILYVDESGVEEVGGGTSHFVLLGLAIPASQWKSADAQIGEVKDRFGLRDVEIHAAWMARKYCEQDSVPDFASLAADHRREAVQTSVKRRAGVIGVSGNPKKAKAYRREARAILPYSHLTRDQRLACLQQLCSTVAGWTDARVFAEAISKPDFRPGTSTPYEMAFEQVLTRYQAFLGNVNSNGIVVHDNNTKVAPRLHALCCKFHEQGTFYRRIPNIVETPLFVDSSLTGMIQMADLCSFALRRFLENGDRRLWTVLESRVDRNRGALVGVRHYTGRRRCTCHICMGHRRRT